MAYTTNCVLKEKFPLLCMNSSSPKSLLELFQMTLMFPFKSQQRAMLYEIITLRNKDWAGYSWENHRADEAFTVSKWHSDVVTWTRE